MTPRITLKAPAFVGLLLLVLPAGVFKVVVPVLIILAVSLVVAQPWLSRRLTGADHPARRTPPGDLEDPAGTAAGSVSQQAPGAADRFRSHKG